METGLIYKKLGFKITKANKDMPNVRGSSFFENGMNKYIKQLDVKSEWGKIEPFLQNPKKVDPETIEVFQLDLAHNFIDRGKDRFHEKFLKTLSNTLLGKSVLIGHAWSLPGIGRIYDTGVKVTDTYLPVNKDLQIRLRWLKTNFYMSNDGKSYYADFLKGAVEIDNASVVSNIYKGLMPFASVGFGANSYKAVYDQKENLLFYEIGEDGQGEGYEGSLVWLGQQQNAGIVQEMKKGMSIHISKDEYERIFAERDYNKLIELLTQEVKGKMDLNKEPKDQKMTLGEEDLTPTDAGKTKSEETMETKKTEGTTIIQNFDTSALFKGMDERIKGIEKRMEAKKEETPAEETGEAPAVEVDEETKPEDSTDDPDDVKTLKAENENLKKVMETQTKQFEGFMKDVEKRLGAFEEKVIKFLDDTVPMRQGETKASEASIMENKKGEAGKGKSPDPTKDKVYGKLLRENLGGNDAAIKSGKTNTDTMY